MVNFVNVPCAKFPCTDNKSTRLNPRASSEFAMHVHVVVAPTGAPQGSIMGSSVYNIFTNGLL